MFCDIGNMETQKLDILDQLNFRPVKFFYTTAPISIAEFKKKKKLITQFHFNDVCSLWATNIATF